MKKFYLFFVGLILCFNSQSQISQFNDSSMYGGKIRTFAKNSSCVLVGTDGGIFKTSNQGQSWTNTSMTFDPNSVSCRKIVSIGNDFYAMSDNNSNGSMIYKTINNGTNWNPLSLTSWWPQSIGKISATLYALGGDMAGGHLYSSTDGNNWTQKALIWTNSSQGNTELFSFNQTKLYIAVNNSLYYTSDGNLIDTVTMNGLSSSSFTDGDGNIGGDALGNLYFNENNALYKYNFTSKIWSDITSGKIAAGYQIQDISITDNAIFIIAMNSSIGMKFYRSTSQGTTFSELTSTGLATPMISNIIEVTATNFIGNWLDDRILLSSNGGNSWSYNATQYIATYTGNLALSGNTLLFSREVKGIVATTNQGLNWSIANNGIPGFGGIAWFINEIIPVKDMLFSLVQTDPFNNQIGMYKSSNNGTTWTSSPIPSPYNMGEYSFAGKCDSALFVNHLDTNSNNYNLLVSFNNGSTWTKPNSLISNVPVYLKGPKNCLFAFFASQNNDWDDFSNVSRLNNFGASYTDINPGFLFNSNFLIKRINSDRGNKGSVMMDFDVANNKAIFAVRDRMLGNNVDRLYVYDISSNAWSEIITSGLTTDYVFTSIKYTGNNVWLLATTSGLFKSTNGGVNWTITHNPASWQKGIFINSIQMIGNKAFLGTLANGVWVNDLSVGILEQVNDNDLQLFPNPTTGLLNISIPDFDGKTASFSLYSMDGKELMNKVVTTQQFQLDLSDLPSSSYFIVINSNRSIFKKTIIHQ